MTGITTKYESYLITKFDKNLLQNEPDFSYKMRQFSTTKNSYHKKQGDFITKFDSYCKMRRYSLISLFHQFNLNIGDFV